MTDGSGLKLYSLGIVVEAKPDGSDWVLVSPVESLNIQTPGKIKDYKKKYTGSIKELGGKDFKTEHEAKNYLRAKWIPFGCDNRLSAPDVDLNETILLFKFGDVDEYYWTTIMREPTLRRKETSVHAISNKPEGTLEEYDLDSSYWIKWSTKDKIIHFHTSNNDGEAFKYDVKIDTGNSFAEITDDAGNYFKIDSPSGTITAEALQHIHLKAPLITLEANRVVNDAPSVINTGNETTSGTSHANPHVHCVD